MRTCEYAGAPLTEPRSHPWIDSRSSAGAKYYDLTASPAHIRSSLEDFQPWSRYAAIEDFYCLLEWINRVECAFESNDCSFVGPEINEDATFLKTLKCSGRIMLLFRALARNTHGGQVERLKNQLHAQLAQLDINFRWGVVGTTLVPVHYRALPNSDYGQLGSQLMVSFWAWGDTEADTMQNLQRLFRNLSVALLKLSVGSTPA